MYENIGKRDPVALFLPYSEKRPSKVCGNDDPCFLAHRTISLSATKSNLWFLRQRVGAKTVWVNEGHERKRGLDKNKRLTNHSARKYLIQKLRSNNIQANDICQISCHTNVKSVENYSCMTEEKQKQSNLKPVKPLKY